MDNLELQIQLQRDARERFTHQATKIKNVLHPPLLIAMMLYPSLITFTLVARNASYSVTNPRPTDAHSPPGPDQWETSNARVFCRTFFSFMAVTFVHLFLLSYMRVEGDAGAPRLSRFYAWIAPVIFWFTTSVYFYNYVTLARYGLDVAECITGACFSFAILAATVFLLWRPLKTHKVMRGI